MITLPTTILTQNTCLLRGKSKSDSAIKKKRWFGYFGSERNIERFCISKNFVSKYAHSGFEYYNVTKNIHLLSLPYIPLYEYTEQDFHKALDICIALVDYINEVESPIVKQYGKKRVIQDILAVIFTEDDVPEQYTVIMERLKNLKDKVGYNEYNPDYTFAALICEIGFDGWLRYASSEDISAGDEVFFCDIEKMKSEGYVEENNVCNLSNC